MNHQKIKIGSTRKLTDYAHLNLFEIRYTDKLANDKTWIVASRSKTDEAVLKPKKPDAVVIVPFHSNQNRLVLIREFRVALGDYQIGFPAGLVDAGESIADSAARELKEETGLTIVRVVKTSPAVFSSSGMTDESVCLVYVECEGEPTSAENETSEDIQTLLVSQSSAAAMLTNPDLKFDVKAWMALSIYSQIGRLY